MSNKLNHSSTIAIKNSKREDASDNAYDSVTAACCQQQFAFNDNGDFVFRDHEVCALTSFFMSRPH